MTSLRDVDVRARDATEMSGTLRRDYIGLSSSISQYYSPSLLSSRQSDGVIGDPAPVNSRVVAPSASDRSFWTNFPVVATPICAGTPSHTRVTAAGVGTSRFHASQRQSDWPDPIGPDRIAMSASTHQSQASMPVNFNQISDHRYSGYASVSYPQLSYQNPSVSAVTGSTSVHPTAPRNYPLPIGSASADPPRPDRVVTEYADTRCVSEQNVYRMPSSSLQQPQGHASAAATLRWSTQRQSTRILESVGSYPVVRKCESDYGGFESGAEERRRIRPISRRLLP